MKLFLLIFMFPCLALARSFAPCCVADYQAISSLDTGSYEFPLTALQKSASTPVLIPTFNSIGVYWKPGAFVKDTPAYLRYREAGTESWKEGIPLSGDARSFSGDSSERTGEYRGSLVMLKPGTKYTVQVASKQGEFAEESVSTWADWPVIKEVVNLSASPGTAVEIIRGGDKNGYVLYTVSGPIDGQNKLEHGLVIKANFVIVQNVEVRNTMSHAIVISEGVSNVLIDKAYIHHWGSKINGYPVDLQSGVYVSRGTERIVVQNSYITMPNTSSNSWEENNVRGDKHPMGPQAISLYNSYGNNVIRNNHIDSGDGRFFNDCIGGGDNFSFRGAPGRDSDIYGNYIKGCLDDAIESEGGNMNVRIFLNYIDQSFVMFGTSPTVFGPLYIFRNITHRSQRSSQIVDGRGSMLKLQYKNSSKVFYGGGKVYFYNNMAFRSGPYSGVSRGIYGSGSVVLNIDVVNNMIDVRRDIDAVDVKISEESYVNSNFLSGASNFIRHSTNENECVQLGTNSVINGSGEYIPNVSLHNKAMGGAVGAVENSCDLIRFNLGVLNLN